jgi:hypothetical protein
MTWPPVGVDNHTAHVEQGMLAIGNTLLLPAPVERSMVGKCGDCTCGDDARRCVIHQVLGFAHVLQGVCFES